MRTFLDTLAAHTRELGRHGIIWILTTGTALATIYALSGGQLTLPSVLERTLSIGGIAAGLELAIIYVGFHRQTLDMRIRTAKRQETREEYQREARLITRSFFALLIISYVCGGIYRTQALHSAVLGWFEAAIPPVLIYIFTIVLRKIPPDYAEIGRQATQRSLVELNQASSTVLVRTMRKLGRGYSLTEQDMQGLRMAIGLQRMWATAPEQNALDYAIAQSGGGAVVEADAQEWLTTAQIMDAYGVPRRTAQQWVSEIPGRRRAERGNGWLVEANRLYQARGIPGLSVGHRSASGGMRARTRAMETQDGAGGTQIVAVEAQ